MHVILKEGKTVKEKSYSRAKDSWDNVVMWAFQVCQITTSEFFRKEGDLTAFRRIPLKKCVTLKGIETVGLFQP